MKKSSRPAVFLDRDGTLLTERGYLTDPKKIFFYPGVFPALKKLSAAGFRLVVVTNQSGVGRGYLTLDTLKKINAIFTARLRAKGVRLDGIYFCPHLPTAECTCRKPKTGLPLRAAKDLGLDVARSFVVGDQLTDINMARGLGVPGVLVLTGSGRSLRAKAKRLGAKISSRFDTAVAWILSQSRI